MDKWIGEIVYVSGWWQLDIQTILAKQPTIPNMGENKKCESNHQLDDGESGGNHVGNGGAMEWLFMIR